MQDPLEPNQQEPEREPEKGSEVVKPLPDPPGKVFQHPTAVTQSPSSDRLENKSSSSLKRQQRNQLLSIPNMLFAGAACLFLGGSACMASGILLIAYNNSAGGGVFGAGGTMMGASATMVCTGVNRRAGSKDSDGDNKKV